MTEPTGFDLLELATPYALHAISDTERATVDRQLAAAATPVANAFRAEVRAIHETMALVSAVTAAEPPAQLRAAVVAAAQSEQPRQLRWRTLVAGRSGRDHRGIGRVRGRRRAATCAVAQHDRADHGRTRQADGFRSAGRRDSDGGLLPGHERRCADAEQRATALAGHRVRNVADRRQGPDLRGHDGPRVRHTDDHARAARLGKSGMLAFTVEPGSGSPKPTGSIIAKLPLG